MFLTSPFIDQAITLFEELVGRVIECNRDFAPIDMKGRTPKMAGVRVLEDVRALSGQSSPAQFTFFTVGAHRSGPFRLAIGAATARRSYSLLNR
jgi:hypothetical protein